MIYKAVEVIWICLFFIFSSLFLRGSGDGGCHQFSQNIWFERLTVVLRWFIRLYRWSGFFLRTGRDGQTGIKGSIRGPRGPKKNISQCLVGASSDWIGLERSKECSFIHLHHIGLFGLFWSQRCIWVSSQCAKSFRRFQRLVAICYA